MADPVILDRATMLELLMVTCPHCASGLEPRKRTDTGEFVHDTNNTHGLCWANGIRQSRFMKVFEDQNG